MIWHVFITVCKTRSAGRSSGFQKKQFSSPHFTVSARCPIVSLIAPEIAQLRCLSVAGHRTTTPTVEATDLSGVSPENDCEHGSTRPRLLRHSTTYMHQPAKHSHQSTSLPLPRRDTIRYPPSPGRGSRQRNHLGLQQTKLRFTSRDFASRLS